MSIRCPSALTSATSHATPSAFLIRELVAHDPILDLSVFADRNFATGAALSALVGFGTVAVAEQIEMFALLADRRYEEAAHINDGVIQPLADALFAPPVRNYRARLKEALRLQGVLPRATVRRPLLDLDDPERESVRVAVDAVRIAMPAHA